MSISLASISRSAPNRPPVVLVHGGPGVGKTTFAAQAEDALFILIEDGLGSLEVNTFKDEHGNNRTAKSYDEFMQMLAIAFSADFKWIVIDSLSALEPLIWDKVAKDENKAQIEDLGFGKGYVNALKYWREVFTALGALTNDKKAGAILIAHSDIVRFESPDSPAYDRVQIKLHKRAFQLAFERCDIIGYASQQVFVKTDGKGERERKIGVGTGERVLNLAERPAFIAKNRYSMPDQIPFVWDVFESHLPHLRGASRQAMQESVT